MRLSVKVIASSLGLSLPPSSALRGHEDNVGEKVVGPILRALKYDPSLDIFPKPTLTHPILRGGARFPDYGVLEYDRKRYGMVVSLKPYGEGLTLSHEGELCGYCALAGSLYGLLTNGIELVVIKPRRGVIEWEQVSSIPSKLQLQGELGIAIPAFSDYDLTFAARVTEKLSPQIISRIADEAHNLIRSRKGMLIPSRIYEFTKLVVLRIIDEMKFKAGEQKELRMSSSFLKELTSKGVSIESYIENFFSSVRSETGLFELGEVVDLPPDLVEELIARLDFYPLWSEELGFLSEIYEGFLMRTMTGRELGDYFTPRPIINAIVEMIDPSPKDKVLDPACGTGGFLSATLRYVAEKAGCSPRDIAKNYYGIDIFDIIAKLCRIDLWLHGDSHENVVKADSLNPDESPDFLKEALLNPHEKGFDIILTNPPFGRKSKNIIPGDYLRRLSEKWDKLKVRMFNWCYRRGRWHDAPPQAVFMELCIKALKPGGRLGIIVDNGLLSNISEVDQMVRNLIRETCIVEAIVGLPKGTFKAYGSNVWPNFLIMHRKEEREEQGKIYRAELRKVGIQPSRNIYVEDSDEDLKKAVQAWKVWKSN